MTLPEGPERGRPKPPRFGDRVKNHMASADNPTRSGTFVRVVRRSGRLNPGTWWECTDEKGDFWLSDPANCTVEPGS